MNKKISNIVRLIVCAALIIIGVITLFGGFTGDNNYYSPSNYNYDVGYATFGADFYNFVSNNAAYAAYNTARVAARVSDLIDLMENIFGFAFIAVGLLGICKFGIKEEKRCENCSNEVQTENSVKELVVEESATGEATDKF